METTCTIGPWRFVSKMGLNPYGPEAARAEAMLNGYRVGCVIRHGAGADRLYMAGHSDFTVGEFRSLGEALDAIAQRAQRDGKAAEHAPLLLLSCSAQKRATTGPVPFIDLYDGPMWRQVRASSVPASSVAALSAEHGFLAPGTPVAAYDRRLDESRLAELARAPSALVDAIDGHRVVLFFGGDLYRRLIRASLAGRPDLLGRVRYATGSYLQQRRQLGEELRRLEVGEAPATQDEELPPLLQRLA